LAQELARGLVIGALWAAATPPGCTHCSRSMGNHAAVGAQGLSSEDVIPGSSAGFSAGGRPTSSTSAGTSSSSGSGSAAGASPAVRWSDEKYGGGRGPLWFACPTKPMCPEAKACYCMNGELTSVQAEMIGIDVHGAGPLLETTPVLAPYREATMEEPPKEGIESPSRFVANRPGVKELPHVAGSLEEVFLHGCEPNSDEAFDGKLRNMQLGIQVLLGQQQGIIDSIAADIEHGGAAPGEKDVLEPTSSVPIDRIPRPCRVCLTTSQEELERLRLKEAHGSSEVEHQTFTSFKGDARPWVRWRSDKVAGCPEVEIPEHLRDRSSRKFHGGKDHKGFPAMV